jgi:hypothetical protein
LAERGIFISYETIRRWVDHFGSMVAAGRWVDHFGSMVAAGLRKPRPKPNAGFDTLSHFTGFVTFAGFTCQ